MVIFNLTPHDVLMLLPTGEEFRIPRSGAVARVSATTRQVGVLTVHGREIPAVATTFGSLEGLLTPDDWTWFIVSALAQQVACATGRHDALVPTDLVRDEQGRVVGARALQVCCERALVKFRQASP